MSEKERNQQFIDFFKHKFKPVRDLDINKLEHKLGTTRTDLICSLVFYRALCQLITSRDWASQSKTLNNIGSKGINLSAVRSVFPEH